MTRTTLNRSLLKLSSRSFSFISNHDHNAFISASATAIAPKTISSSSLLADYTIAIKDNISTIDFPTTCASALLKNYQSPFDATVVKLLRENGASIIGKTNMDEFGMGSHSINSTHGPVKDIRANQFYSAGGSSGGSAIAVAKDLCSVALGTDTGGSVRLPAAYCGVFGFKPSYGLLSRYGVVAYANSLDTVGLFAKSTDKIHVVFNAINHYDQRDPTSLPQKTRDKFKINQLPRQFKIGIPMNFNIKELDPVIRKAWIKTCQTFQENGHEIILVDIPSFQTALSTYYIIAPAEASSNLARYDGVRYGNSLPGSDGQGSTLYSATRDAGFGDEVKQRILLGSYTLSSEAIDSHFLQAQRVRRLLQTDMNSIFQSPNPLMYENEITSGQVDVLIVPTAPNLPPLISELERMSPIQTYGMDVFTVLASLAGLPAVSVPVAGNNPIGMQIIGQFGSDELVLSVSKKMEEFGLV